MNLFAPLLVILIGIAVIVGSICGIIAAVNVQRLRRKVEQLQSDLARLKYAPPASATVRAAESTIPDEREEPGDFEPEPVAAAAEVSETTPEPSRKTPPPPPKRPLAPKPAGSAPDGRSFEAALGGKWLAWGGAVMFIIGIAFLLKYAYDNDIIGPQGRLAIGVLSGVVALVTGDVLRRRDYTALFQTLTGLGVAIFYTCIYFSFEVYELTGPQFSMALAVGVTVGAIALAVGHDALSIAVLAVIGGFLSPVLLSTRENQPYILFTYITLLDGVALGAAYFRRWRGLDLFTFACTFILYQSWYVNAYDDGQMAPALLYTTVFYLLFLLIPILNSLARKAPEGLDGLTLIVANAFLSLYSYYNVLFEDYRSALGFVALGQAALVFALFRLWVIRIGRAGRTGQSLLIISLALITLAIPLELELYGIPIVWAAEGVLFVYLGIRFNNSIARVGGIGALVLAAGGLLYRLPLHELAFVPVFNVPFGSWLLVIAASAGAAFLLLRHEYDETDPERFSWVLPAALSYVLVCVLLSLETAGYWEFAETARRTNAQFSSLVVLWAVIPSVTLAVLYALRLRPLYFVSWIGYGVSALFFLGAIVEYHTDASLFLLNATFLTKLALILSVWVAAAWMRREQLAIAGDALELSAHFALVVLMAAELDRWSGVTDVISPQMGQGLISAAWAAQAFTLIFLGLLRPNRNRRYFGFALFALAAVKTIGFDVREPVYKIVSFLATGVLALAAAYFYQRLSPRLLGETRDADEPAGLSPDAP